MALKQFTLEPNAMSPEPEPYRVLGTINPLLGIDPKRVKVSAIEATIESDIRTFLTLAGFHCLDFIIRNPDKDVKFLTSQQSHKDKYVSDYFVVWASENPTVIVVDKDGTRFYPKPFQVVLVNDRLCEHHKPLGARGRWFVRASVEKRGII